MGGVLGCWLLFFFFYGFVVCCQKMCSRRRKTKPVPLPSKEAVKVMEGAPEDSDNDKNDKDGPTVIDLEQPKETPKPPTTPEKI